MTVDRLSAPPRRDDPCFLGRAHPWWLQPDLRFLGEGIWLSEPPLPPEAALDDDVDPSPESVGVVESPADVDMAGVAALLPSELPASSGASGPHATNRKRERLQHDLAARNHQVFPRLRISEHRERGDRSIVNTKIGPS